MVGRIEQKARGTILSVVSNLEIELSDMKELARITKKGEQQRKIEEKTTQQCQMKCVTLY